MSSTSPEYRQFTRQNYIASSRRDGGISHLWHMERMARIRFRPPKGIQDAPEVDFRHPESMDPTLNTAYLDRQEREARGQEKAIFAGNQTLLRHLIEASDPKKRVQHHLHQIPTAAEVAKYDRAAEQVLYRDRIRQRRFREMDRGNQILLHHLLQVRPGTRTTKSLDTWYHTVHKRRLRQLSRFRRDEPYAGAEVLQRECGVRLPQRGHGDGTLSVMDDPVRSVQPPLIEGHPHPPAPMEELIRTAPQVLQPALTSTTYGRPATASARAPASKKPEWQSIAATDIPLMHYASDRALADGTATVTPEEEGGCTRLWRESVQAQRHRYEQQKAREERAVSTMRATDELRRVSLQGQQARYRKRWSTARERGSISGKRRSTIQVAPPGLSDTAAATARTEGLVRRPSPPLGGPAYPRATPLDAGRPPTAQRLPQVGAVPLQLSAPRQARPEVLMPEYEAGPMPSPHTADVPMTRMWEQPIAATIPAAGIAALTQVRAPHPPASGITHPQSAPHSAVKPPSIPAPPPPPPVQPDESAYDAMMKEWTKASKASGRSRFIAL